MATYTHHPIDVPQNVIWFDEDPVGVLAADGTILAVANLPGATATVFIGSDFTYGPPPDPNSIGMPTGGLVTSILRTDIDGIDVYETIELSTPISLVALINAETKADFFNLIMSGNDTLNGYAGNDSLLGGPGGDALNGGGGFDFADYVSAPEGVLVDLGNPAANTGHAAGDTYSSIEGLWGTAFDDTLIGDANRNEIHGGEGNDRLEGGPFVLEDVANAFLGDVMFGGPGDDTYVVDSYYDAVIEYAGEGIDTVLALVWESPGIGQDVENVIFIGDGDFQSHGNHLDNVLAGGAGNDRLFGDSSGDPLSDGSNDTLVGGAGDDYLSGDSGADRLFGGEGNDTIWGDHEDIEIDGGPGFDRLYLGSSVGVTLDLGAIGIEWVQYGHGDDTLDATTQTQAVTIYASDGNDQVIGSAHTDTLLGEGGSDTITGGAGNDAIDGGAGSDTVVYRGNRADYSASGVPTNFNITDGVVGRDGADTVFHVELLQFADGTFSVEDLLPPPPSGAPHDFNGDGMSDVLLQNTGNGGVYLWEMDGTSLVGNGFAGAAPGAEWQVKGTGDFNGDGKSDILFQNAATSDVALWEMDDTSIIGSGYVGWQPGLDWQVKGSGDFNGDGKDDVLLQNSGNGGVYLWEMDGTSLVGNGFAGPAPGAEWQVKGTGDFNGDGKDDILFQNAVTSDVALWEMDSTNIIGSGFVGWQPGLDWQVEGTGDFNGDGKDDVLLQNAATSDVYIWELDGTSLVGNGFAGPTPGLDWQVKGTGDFNGDGKSDILFQNAATTDVVLWEMDGTTIIGSGFVGSTPGPDWLVQL